MVEARAQKSATSSRFFLISVLVSESLLWQQFAFEFSSLGLTQEVYIVDLPKSKYKKEERLKYIELKKLNLSA